MNRKKIAAWSILWLGSTRSALLSYDSCLLIFPFTVQYSELKSQCNTNLQLLVTLQ